MRATPQRPTTTPWRGAAEAEASKGAPASKVPLSCQHRGGSYSLSWSGRRFLLPWVQPAIGAAIILAACTCGAAGGQLECWKGGFTPDLCCPDGGLPICFNGEFTYEACCHDWDGGGAEVPDHIRRARKSLAEGDLDITTFWNQQHAVVLGYMLRERLPKDGGVPSGIVVEVGVRQGHFARAMMRMFQLLGVDVLRSYYCIDSWGAYEGPPCEEWAPREAQQEADDMQVAMGNLREFMPVVRIVQLESLKAARLFDDASVDLVFVDACHGYAHVAADMKAWWPKVRPGGIMAGHDLSMGGVFQAVAEFTTEHRLPLADVEANVLNVSESDSWIIVKPEQ